MSKDEWVSRTAPVHEDMRMQQRVWRFERVGWYILVLLMVMALGGLFGNGLLSDAEVTSRDGRLKVEYQRLSRSGTTDQMVITIQGVPGQLVKMHMGGSLLREASIETLQPEPVSSVSQGRALLLELGADKDGMAILYLTLRSDSVGSLEGVVRVGSESAVRFSTFLFP